MGERPPDRLYTGPEDKAFDRARLEIPASQLTLYDSDGSFNFKVLLPSIAS